MNESVANRAPFDLSTEFIRVPHVIQVRDLPQMATDDYQLAPDPCSMGYTIDACLPNCVR